MRNKDEVRKDALDVMLKAFNRILYSVAIAEDEVRSKDKYWKACETLYRLTISIRDTKEWVDKKWAEIKKEVAEIKASEEKPTEEKNPDSAQMDRFDRREELMNPDPFERGNWNKI